MIHQSAIGGAIDPAQGDGVLVVDENFKILPRLKTHLLPHGTWQDNLTFL